MAVIVIVLAIVLVINAIGATLMKNSAIMKGYGDDSHIWAICFCLGVIGYLYVISLPDKIVQSQNQQLINLAKEGKGR